MDNQAAEVEISKFSCPFNIFNAASIFLSLKVLWFIEYLGPIVGFCLFVLFLNDRLN